MNGSTKILTVSYGTFSCTLEGFDDPLGTMRDIAEYFRDLAADDRYFGAEPPTPDVEMLQNIAQKEVDRRVEARMSETGVALRQVEKRAEPSAPPPAVEDAEVADQDEAPETDSRDLAARVAGRIAAEAAAERVKSVTPPAPQPAPADADRGPLAFDDEYLMSDEPEDVLAVDPDARPLGEGPAETVAEKLRRIRAVVSRNVEEAAERRPFSQPPAEETAPRDRAHTATIEAISADLSDEDGNLYDAGYEDEDPAASAEPTEDAPAEEPVAEPAPDTAEDESQDETAFVMDAPTEDDAEDRDAAPATEARDPSGWDFEDDDEDNAPEEPADEPAPAARPLRTVSQIIGNVAGRVERERAEARARLDSDETPEATDAAETPEVTTDDARADRTARSLTPEPEGDVGRLMAETDTKLNDDDVVRRRRVISQMRAAVAATKADRLVSRQVSKEVAEEQEKSRYRQDLSQVVRPSRPTADSATGHRRSSSPPLVLVSSQRVDSGLSVGHAVSLSSEQEGFAQFARTVGAKDLSELLEAAAAYTVFSEGQSSFTRPEIMKRVARVDPTIRLSREESLRSFGQLLREGTFKKLERGQFTIDNGSRFKPNDAIANGRS
ncbi:hypothetical protein EF888_19055 [Silicimonas algicola]|uniref:Lipoprotein n=1 Tax=Silicimonas algicola TaxID=1826607 RepID=A0A316G2D9_9RHOB|nr:hypothetical protein [Silicimonas algicola]AZQ69044.1 hypothetical protein EF888_19055 [Silicimonas algicola]PWK54066.1 hypothetical protein C8D95_11254 [Silicimonas algicola]